jgi:hypothetical protein
MSDIVLSPRLDELALADNREELVNTLTNLDSEKLSAVELKRYFDALKLAMGIFIQKVNTLEVDIFDLRREQRASEARMESMYLKAQLEVQSLKNSINEMRLSRNRINQIVKVAETLRGNAYAPYAIKSLVDGMSGGKSLDPNSFLSLPLPSDFNERLEFATAHGFKWNQNNRPPAKNSKKLLLLEQWEDQFCQVEKLTLDQITNKKLISGMGPGAVAGALICLERELGSTLTSDRATLSVFNCYQKAIKLYQQKNLLTNQPALPPPLDYRGFVGRCFSNTSSVEKDKLTSRLEKNQPTTALSILDVVKKSVSKEMLPDAVTYDQEHSSDSSRLYALQSGHYDSQLICVVQSLSL